MSPQRKILLVTVSELSARSIMLADIYRRVDYHIETVKLKDGATGRRAETVIIDEIGEIDPTWFKT